MIVFRGTLVHCKVPEKIEVLQDHVIGMNTSDYGRVSINLNDSGLILKTDIHHAVPAVKILNPTPYMHAHCDIILDCLCGAMH